MYQSINRFLASFVLLTVIIIQISLYGIIEVSGAAITDATKASRTVDNSRIKPPKRRVIIDTDPGSDDAQAIMMILADPNIIVMAITTVTGNTPLSHATKNAQRLLKYFNKTSIPVYAGAKEFLKGDPLDVGAFFGKDGFGDVVLPGVDEPGNNVLTPVKTEKAAQAIVRIVNKNIGKITLVALGPLTNIALSLHLDPELGSKLDDVVIMGANYKGVGNTMSMGAAEFNWWADPEAANMMLVNMKKKVTIVPLETCIESSLDWSFYDQLVNQSTRGARFVELIDKVFVANIRYKEKSIYYQIWDQIAVSVFLDRNVTVTEFRDTYAQVETCGPKTKGQMIIDWNGEKPERNNVRLITKVDRKPVKAFIERAVKNL